MLRQQISRMLVQHGLDVTPERFNNTNGSKQGLSLVVHTMSNPSWVVWRVLPGTDRFYLTWAKVIGI